MQGSGTNPENKKKKTDADQPEEERDAKKKKRNNPKSETDKDEKNRNPHDPDAKKNVGNEVDEGKTFWNQAEVANEIHNIIFGVSNKKPKDKSLTKDDISKMFNEKALKLTKKINENQTKTEKKKEKEDKKKRGLKAIGETISAVGEGVQRAYNTGRNLL